MQLLHVKVTRYMEQEKVLAEQARGGREHGKSRSWKEARAVPLGGRDVCKGRREAVTA